MRVGLCFAVNVILKLELTFSLLSVPSPELINFPKLQTG